MKHRENQLKDGPLGSKPLATQGRSLFETVMGPDFDKLHPALRSFHSARGERFFKGSVRTFAPSGLLAKAMSHILGTPCKASEGRIDFKLLADGSCETWTRFFPTKTMSSTMRLCDGKIVERLGPALITFGLAAVGTTLIMEVKALRFLGIPCPRWLIPAIEATERGDGDLLHFHVRATLPLIGTVAQYVGNLHVAPPGPPTLSKSNPDAMARPK